MIIILILVIVILSIWKHELVDAVFERLETGWIRIGGGPMEALDVPQVVIVVVVVVTAYAYALCQLLDKVCGVDATSRGYFQRVEMLW